MKKFALNPSAVFCESVAWKNPTRYKIDGQTFLMPLYAKWKDMLGRSSVGKQKHNSNYKAYHVKHQTSWESYDLFLEWAEKQIGSDLLDEHGRSYCLDKDILFVGNNFYCEDACVFVPNEVNSFFARHDKKGKLPTGVSHKNGRFAARCHDHVIGMYDTCLKAYNAYCKHKNEKARELAKKFYGHVDPRVYELLRTYDHKDYMKQRKLKKAIEFQLELSL